MTKIESVVKTALLNGKDFSSKRGWLIKISADDKVQIWPPKGEGRETTLAFLDKAVKDFCKQADVMAPGVNETNAPKSTSDGSLGKDTSGKSPKKFDPSVNKQPKPDGSFTDKSLGSDTSMDEAFATPSINKDMTPDDEGLTDTDLGSDSSGNSTKFDNKVVNVQSDGRTGKRKKVAGEKTHPGPWSYLAAWLHDDHGRQVPWNREEYSELSDDQVLEGYSLGYVRNDTFGAGEEVLEDPTVGDLPLLDDVNPETNLDEADEDEFAYDEAMESTDKFSRKGKIQDTFANGPDPSEIYRKLNAKSVSKELLNGILNEEEWEATQRLAQMDKNQPKRGPGMPGKGKGNFSEGPGVGGQIGAEDDEDITENEQYNKYFRPYEKPNRDEEEDKAVGGKKSKRTAGPKLREKWLNDGGYHREIESESAEELHALVQGFGGDDVDWAKFKPVMPDEKDAAEVQQDPANAPQQVAAGKRGQFDDDSDPTKDPYSSEYELTSEDYAESYLNGNISDVREAINSGEANVNDVLEAVEQMGGPQEVKIFCSLMLRKAQSADVEAVDDDAKKTIKNYMGEYGEELVKDEGVAPKGKNPRKMLDKGKRAQSSDYDLYSVVYAMEGNTKLRVKPIGRDDALATLEDEETGERTRIPISDLREFYTLLDTHEDVISRPEDSASGDDDAKYAKKTLKNKKAQAAPPATPAAPAPAAPGGPGAAPAPGGQPAAPAPKAPAPKAPAGLQPGVGDAGIQALGWTAEDVQGMTDEQKKGILQIKLTKPGTQPKQQMPEKSPAPKTPAPGGPGTPPAGPQGPSAPGSEPAPPAPSAPSPKAVKGIKKGKKAQAAPLPETEEAPAAPAQEAPQSPAAPGKAPATPAAPKGPTKPAGGPAQDPGQAGGGQEQQAFQILQEVQQMQVNAATPNEVGTAKVSALLQRLLTELGITPDQASKLFGLQRGNFGTLFK